MAFLCISILFSKKIPTFAPMKIGQIEFGPHPVFLAPMEDVTDIGFRLLCKRFGASMVYTEFVSAEALIRDVKSTQQKVIISDEERPVGIQIYGRDVDAMVEAAKWLRLPRLWNRLVPTSSI